MRFLLLFAVVCLSWAPSSTYSQQTSRGYWNHVATYDEGFAAPYDFDLLVNDDGVPASVVAIDPFASNQVLSRIRLDDARVVGPAIASGQGPGELSGENIKISRFSDGGFLVWDNGQQRANVYTSDLQFQAQVRGVSGIVGELFLVNDSTVAVSDFNPGSTLFALHRLDREDGVYRLSEAPVATVDVSDDPALDQGAIDENVMLRQGVHQTTGEQAFFGFTYGSLVLALREDRVRWATTAPPQHELPLYEYRDGNAIVAPDVTEHPLGILDLTSDGRYVYVLYSGAQVDRAGLVARMTGAIQRRLEKARHSDRLYVLDQSNGQVVADERLPTRARAISVAGDYLALLTHERDEPAFEIYELPQDW